MTLIEQEEAEFFDIRSEKEIEYKSNVLLIEMEKSEKASSDHQWGLEELELKPSYMNP